MGVREAKKEARETVDRANYNMEDNETCWIDIYVNYVETDESESVTVQLDPDEPECSEPEHDWQAPYHLVGGIEENPGVQGHGGGVIANEVCMHCGCGRVTDTWAQRPDNGEQGLETVEYEVGAYDLEEVG